jgi:hypothetical protein
VVAFTKSGLKVLGYGYDRNFGGRNFDEARATHAEAEAFGGAFRAARAPPSVDAPAGGAPPAPAQRALAAAAAARIGAAPRHAARSGRAAPRSARARPRRRLRARAPSSPSRIAAAR